MTWSFTPGERRLEVRLPDELGGGVHLVEVVGRYTLAARRVAAAA